MTRDKIIATLAKFLLAKPEEVDYALKRAFKDHIGSDGHNVTSECLGDHTLEEYRGARTMLEYILVGEIGGNK
jgi:hypothetical protein